MKRCGNINIFYSNFRLGRRAREERGGGEREGRGRREGRGGRGKTPAARKSKHSGNPVLSPSHGTTLLIGLQELSFLALLKTKILNVATQKLKKENEYKNVFFYLVKFPNIKYIYLG